MTAPLDSSPPADAPREPGSARRVGAHAFCFDLNGGGRLDLAECAGGPILIVNAASRCGFTGQYEGLVRLHKRYAERGLTVLAVPLPASAQAAIGEDAPRESWPPDQRLQPFSSMHSR